MTRRKRTDFMKPFDDALRALPADAVVIGIFMAWPDGFWMEQWVGKDET